MFSSELIDRGQYSNPFWSIPGTRLQLGTVAIVQNGNDVLLVKKAQKPGYEYSGLWTLPGGMIRGFTTSNFRRQICRSAEEQVSRECGIDPRKIRSAHLRHDILPRVTAYSVNSQKKFVLVLPVRVELVDVPSPLAPTARSIDEASWFDLSSIELGSLAPANRLILNDLQPNSSRLIADHSLEHARRLCAEWYKTSLSPEG